MASVRELFESSVKLLKAKWPFKSGPEYEEAETPRILREVFMVSSAVELGPLRLSPKLLKHIQDKFGIRHETIGHWGVVVRDSRTDSATQYDLWSDKPLTRNALRKREVSPDILRRWMTCERIGETNKSDSEIVEISNNFMAEYPVYDLVQTNCQTFALALIPRICNVEVIDTGSLKTVIDNASPGIGLFFATTSSAWEMINRVGKDKTEEVERLKLALQKSNIE